MRSSSAGDRKTSINRSFPLPAGLECEREYNKRLNNDWKFKITSLKLINDYYKLGYKYVRQIVCTIVIFHLISFSN